jgi:hypothetical protein
MKLSDTAVRSLMPRTSVYYLMGRSCPERLYFGLVLTATAREAAVLIPHLSEGPWDHKNPHNRRTFTYRAKQGIWGEKGDIPGYDRLLFCDPETQHRIETTFKELGGWP